MFLMLLHYFAVLFVGLVVWDAYGITAALLAIIIASIPFIISIAAIDRRFVKLIVKDP